VIIQDVTIRQFRCFEESTLRFDGRVVVIEGPNGSGKSSLLEALHYCCYLRSFRTHLNRELVKLDKDFFFIDVGFVGHETTAVDRIQIGFSGSEGKMVKLNQKNVQSYKEILNHFRVVTLSADDLELVHGGPELRRDFLNYAIMLKDPGMLLPLKRYKTVLEQRNSMLTSQPRSYQASDEMEIWTHKLWEESRTIQTERKEYLASLEASVNLLMQTYFADSGLGEDIAVTFDYNAKHMRSKTDDFKTFWSDYYEHHFKSEVDMRRSLFGAHLDDFSIVFQHKKARMYASRGQQKLLALLIKVAQLQQLSLTGEPGVLLLDDFMTDFDHTKIERCIAALKDLDYQMFLSCPVSPDTFLKGLKTSDVCHIKLKI
jgi:DNA replication and repair protein RecF